MRPCSRPRMRRPPLSRLPRRKPPNFCRNSDPDLRLAKLRAIEKQIQALLQAMVPTFEACVRPTIRPTFAPTDIIRISFRIFSSPRACKRPLQIFIDVFAPEVIPIKEEDLGKTFVPIPKHLNLKHVMAKGFKFSTAKHLGSLLKLLIDRKIFDPPYLVLESQWTREAKSQRIKGVDFGLFFLVDPNPTP